MGRSSTIPKFPNRRDLTGIGLSDPPGLDKALSSKFAYRNTYLELDPKLDITSPPSNLHGTLDFLISSDVFEHVVPPVTRAFENSFRLLKPGGLLILTVPFPVTGEHIEHFPNLNEYEIVEFKSDPILVNRTSDGGWEVFENLRFHAGHDKPLEMRVFSRSSVRNELQDAGFEEIVEWGDPEPKFGIPLYKKGASVPISARRPAR